MSDKLCLGYDIKTDKVFIIESFESFGKDVQKRNVDCSDDFNKIVELRAIVKAQNGNTVSGI